MNEEKVIIISQIIDEARGSKLSQEECIIEIKNEFDVNSKLREDINYEESIIVIEQIISEWNREKLSTEEALTQIKNEVIS